jgi:hypothetical protein
MEGTMQRSKCLLLIVTLLFSCFGNKKNNTDSIPVIQQETVQSSSDTSVAEEKIEPVYHNDDENIKKQMKAFIYANEDYLKRYKGEIVFIEKANFGIPDGDNWIVSLYTGEIFIYAINDGRIERKYSLSTSNYTSDVLDNIMRDIPGIRIANSISSIGDFNRDGIDEIFKYEFTGRGDFIYIYGYDEENDIFDFFSDYFEIPITFIDDNYSSSPVKFMTYKGMYGFKVFYKNLEVGGGPGWVSDPDPKNNKWIFYTWDEGQRKYIEVGEVVD